MTTSYQETDTAAGLGSIQACSPVAVSGGPVSKAATIAGTAGTATLTVTVARSLQSPSTCLMFQLGPGIATYPAGTYTLRINVTTASPAGVTWDGIYLCRRTSGGAAVSTVGSVTGLAVAMNSTGVKSANVSGASDTGATTDVLYIVMTFANTGSAATFQMKSDQLIDTPLDLTATGSLAFSAAVVSSEGTPVVTSDGALSLSALSEDGVGTPIVVSTGDVVLAAAVVDGTGTPIVVSTGELALSALSEDGVGTPVVTGTGSQDQPGVSIDGTGNSTIVGTGVLVLTAVSILGDGSPIVAGTGSLVFSAASILAEGSPIVTASGALAFSGVAVAALGSPVVVGAGSLVFSGMQFVEIELPDIFTLELEVSNYELAVSSIAHDAVLVIAESSGNVSLTAEVTETVSVMAEV